MKSRSSSAANQIKQPFYLFSCDTCDYLGTSQMAIGEFFWRDDAGREAAINFQLGICSDCQAVVPMEVLPDRCEFNEARSVLALSAKDRQKLRRSETGYDSGSLTHLVLNDPDAFKVLLGVMRLRNRPLCLNCATPNVNALDLQTRWDDGQLHLTDSRHPLCGGRLQVRRASGWFTSQTMYRRVYSIYGEIIEITEKKYPDRIKIQKEKTFVLRKWLMKVRSLFRADGDVGRS